MGTALLIAVKDLRQRARDRSLLLMAIVVPLGLAGIFSLVFSGVENVRLATFAVADEDRGDIAATFVTEALNPLEQGGVIKLTRAATGVEARALVDAGKAQAAFVIPAGFSEAVLAVRPATLQVVGDVDARVGSFVARSVAESFAAEIRYVQVALTTNGGGDPEQAAATPAPVTLADVPAAKRQLTVTEGFAAGMAVFFLFFTVQFGLSSILDERHDGTLARLLAAPVARRAIIAGKLASSVAVGVVSMAVLMIAATLLLGARWGDPLGVAALVVAGVLAATGVMAVIATFARTAEQAGNQQAIAAVTLGLLGGVFIPAAQAGDVLATAGLITPHRWFLQGLADLGGGGGLGVIVTPVLALLAFAVVTIGIALLRAGRMLHP